VYPSCTIGGTCNCVMEEVDSFTMHMLTLDPNVTFGGVMEEIEDYANEM